MSIPCNWMEPATGFMQRLGFLKILMTITSKSKVTSHDKVNRGFWAITGATKKIDLDDNAKLSRYIVNKRLYGKKNKYSILNFDGERLLTNKGGSIINVQHQDLLLCSDKLPSSTGSITKDSSKDILDWSVLLGLLKSPKYSQTMDGNILKILSDHNENENPFILDLNEKIFFLNTLLKVDDCIILSLILKIYEKFGGNEINRRDSGELLYLTYKQIYDEYKLKARMNVDIRRLRNLKIIIDSIDKQIKKNSGVLGTKELRVTARMEPLVDLKVMEKKNKYSYKYKLTNNLIKCLPNIKRYIENQYNYDDFFSFVNILYDIRARKIINQKDVLYYLFKGYNLVKNPLGLASIENSCLLGGIFSLNDGNLVSRTEMIHSIEDIKKESGKKIRLHVDKHGKLSYFVIDNALLNQYLNEY